MNAKEKTALNSSRNFLSKNIVWTLGFTDKLLEEGLLTEYLLNDIESNESRESKIQALLDVLPLKGGKTFEKFCDVLQLTGHYFLADFLRDEVDRAEDSAIKDLYKRLPFLEKNLRDYEKKKVETYITNKIKEELVKNSWKTEFSQKDKTLAIKEKQIIQNFKFEENNKQNQTTIADLQQKLKESSEEVSMLKAQTSALKQSLVEQEADHKEQLNRQIRFNLANDSSIRRVQDRIEDQESTLEAVRRKINAFQGVSKGTMEKDDIGIPEPEMTSLLGDLDKVLDKLRHLGEMQRKYDSLLEERDWIIMHLGADSNATSLLQAYKKFAVQNDEHLHSLKQEVAKFSDIVREKEVKEEGARTQEKTTNAAHVWQSAIMSIMKKQLQDLKTSAKQKDKKIGVLENDVNTLKSKLASVEKELLENSKMDETDNRLQAFTGNGLNHPQVSKMDMGRSYKNSFLPPLRHSVSPTESPPVNGRKAKPTPGVTMSSLGRGIKPRGHNFSDSLTVHTYRGESKVRYGPPYQSLSHGLGSISGQNRGDFQLGEKAIVGKKIQ